MRLASKDASKRVSVSVDGVSLGSVEAPAAGWTDYRDVSLSAVPVSAGQHTLRLTFETGGVNLNYIDFVEVGGVRQGDVVAGESAYATWCAGCHQDDGLSTAFPLNNELLTYEEMVDAIRDTMPKGNPSDCEQRCAEDTAAYIKNVLFAEGKTIARAPLAARLVKHQYINSVQDIFGVSLSAEEKALIPNEIFDEKGFVTVFDSQPLQDAHIRGYATISRNLVDDKLDLVGFAQQMASCANTSDTCRNALVAELGLRLFRRPLTLSETAQLGNVFDTIKNVSGAGFEDAFGALIRAALQSPYFVYRLEQEIDPSAAYQAVSGYELAARLSFFLWQSSPDSDLLKFAKQIEDSGFKENDLESEVTRMITDDKFDRARAVFWSDYALASSAELTELDSDIADGLQVSLLETLYRASGKGQTAVPLQDLFRLKEFVFTGSVAQWMGLSSKSDGPRVYDVSSLPQRQGIFTHPAFIANMASPSFVGRGTILTERVLCRPIIEPPSSIQEEIDDTTTKTEDLTPREASDFRFGLGGQCLACHQTFEPISFAFEQFDVFGRYAQTDEKGRALFSTGYLQEVTGARGPDYDTAPELMNILASMDETSECFVSNMMLFGAGREFIQKDTEAISTAHASYVSSGGTFNALVKTVAMSPAFRSIQTLKK